MMSEGRGRNKLKLRIPLPKPLGPPTIPPRHKSQRKSKKDAYILFLGQAESGKSTTLNTLFGGREISPVERDTGTQEVIEFTATVDSGQLHVIDTPGLGDINGLEWDSQVLATIETFRNSHTDLQTCIPNIIVVVARFDDNRIAGDLSSFVKMLKSINYQRSKFIEAKHNNLIILLTHFMNAKKESRANPEQRIELVKSLVKTYTNFAHEPVVLLGENEADDWDLEVDPSKSVGTEGGSDVLDALDEGSEKVDTKKEPDDNDKQPNKDSNEELSESEFPENMALKSHLLPTGDSYPQNLIDTILSLSKQSENELSEKIFQEAFQKPKALEFDNPKILPVVEVSNPITQSIMAKLTNIYFSTRSSEMFSKLNDVWVQSMGRSSTDACYEALLVNLEKCRYRDFDQLPQTQELINQFLIRLKPSYDEGVFHLLQKVFYWCPSRLVTVMKKNVGYGFNIGYDGLTEMCPFEFNVNQYKITPLVYRLTSEIKYQPLSSKEEDEKLIFRVFSTREDYWNARLNDFHLKPGQKIVTEGKLKAGYNILKRDEPPSSSSQSKSKAPTPAPRLGRKAKAPVPKPRTKPSGTESSSETTPSSSDRRKSTPEAASHTKPVASIAIAKEFRIGKLILQDEKNLEEIFDPNFFSKVTKLRSFNPSVRSSMNSWRGFLHTFGTHIVKSACIGGVLEITVDKEKLIQRLKAKGKEFNPSNISTYENDMRTELSALFDFGSDNNKFEEGFVIKIETKGGNSLLAQSENFFKMGPNERLQYFNMWKESIHEFPALLDRNVQLIEMKLFIEKIFGSSNETKPLLDSFDVALETLYYKIPKKDRTWKLCNFL